MARVTLPFSSSPQCHTAKRSRLTLYAVEVAHIYVVPTLDHLSTLKQVHVVGALIYLHHYVTRKVLTHIVVSVMDGLNGGGKYQELSPILKGCMTNASALGAVVPER